MRFFFIIIMNLFTSFYCYIRKYWAHTAEFGLCVVYFRLHRTCRSVYLVSVLSTLGNVRFPPIVFFYSWFYHFPVLFRRTEIFLPNPYSHNFCKAEFHLLTH